MKPEDLNELLSNEASLATEWLLCSKIHNNDTHDTATYGSFNNYYDLRKGYCKYAYTEITGYAIELLLDLHRRTGKLVYLENAELAGDWILGMQYNGTDGRSNGGFSYCFHLADRTKAPDVFSFDAGVCIGALSDLYDKTRNNVYLNSAAKGAQWLVETMQNPDGSFRPLSILGEQHNGGDARKKRSSSSSIRNSWYYLNGCHHGKMAIGLLKYYSKCRESRLLESVSSLCKWLIEQQDPCGCFRAASGSNVSFSHTHCYAVEGLLYTYAHLEDQSLFNAAKLGGDWLTKRQRNDGGIPSWTSNRQIFDYTDISAVAQAIRVWSVLYSETEAHGYLKAIEKAVMYLTKMQNIERQTDTFGGFYLVEFDFKLAKYKLKRLYSWSTIFAIHAMNIVCDLSNRKIQGKELW